MASNAKDKESKEVKKETKETKKETAAKKTTKKSTKKTAVAAREFDNLIRYEVHQSQIWLIFFVKS